MFWIEFIVLMLIIVWGTRKGGSFLAMAGGIGMLIFVYIFRVTPSDPPITVILIMLAVITAACTMQATGGLDFMVQLAEKILRKNPKNITLVAPFVAYLFTFCCGTGHIVYSLLPVINEIALENGKRIEITGKIDRVDIAKTEDGNYLRIIDYKSSARNVDLNEVYAGVSIQLLTYLDAICEEEDLMPAGI